MRRPTRLQARSWRLGSARCRAYDARRHPNSGHRARYVRGAARTGGRSRRRSTQNWASQVRMFTTSSLVSGPWRFAWHSDAFRHFSAVRSWKWRGLRAEATSISSNVADFIATYGDRGPGGDDEEHEPDSDGAEPPNGRVEPVAGIEEVSAGPVSQPKRCRGDLTTLRWIGRTASAGSSRGGHERAEAPLRCPARMLCPTAGQEVRDLRTVVHADRPGPTAERRPARPGWSAPARRTRTRAKGSPRSSTNARQG